MEFIAYAIKYTKVINVAGGGLSNGNAYANIEIEYANEKMNEYEITGVFYAEYGKNPCRRKIGAEIDWGEDDHFNVIDWDGNVVNSSGEPIEDDDNEDEDEEEEEDEEDDEEDLTPVNKVIRSIMTNSKWIKNFYPTYKELIAEEEVQEEFNMKENEDGDFVFPNNEEWKWFLHRYYLCDELFAGFDYDTEESNTTMVVSLAENTTDLNTICKAPIEPMIKFILEAMEKEGIESVCENEEDWFKQLKGEQERDEHFAPHVVDIYAHFYGAAVLDCDHAVFTKIKQTILTLSTKESLAHQRKKVSGTDVSR